MAAPSVVPSKIALHTQSRTLELVWDQQHYQLEFELLRVYSPSAEVRGHGQPILQTGKRDVRIRDLAPVGNYALKITFDDGHDSGLYHWQYLREMCEQQAEYWQRYIAQMEAAEASRDATQITMHPANPK